MQIHEQLLKLAEPDDAFAKAVQACIPLDHPPKTVYRGRKKDAESGCLDTIKLVQRINGHPGPLPAPSSRPGEHPA